MRVYRLWRRLIVAQKSIKPTSVDEHEDTILDSMSGGIVDICSGFITLSGVLLSYVELCTLLRTLVRFGSTQRSAMMSETLTGVSDQLRT